MYLSQRSYTIILSAHHVNYIGDQVENYSCMYRMLYEWYVIEATILNEKGEIVQLPHIPMIPSILQSHSNGFNFRLAFAMIINKFQW